MAVHRDIIRNLRKALVPRAYTLLQAKDGQEVLESLERHKGNVYLLIVALEVLVVRDLSLLRALVTRKQIIQLKIIAVSRKSLPSPLLEQVATALGLDAILPRPIDQKQWQSTIRSVLRTRQVSGSTNAMVASALVN
jgi:CheY-like chemotaxis protein